MVEPTTEPTTDWMRDLREADSALARISPSASLDARLRASLDARSAEGASPGMRQGLLVLAASLGLLFVGLRAVDRSSAGIIPSTDVDASTTARPAADDPSEEPSTSPVERRRSADDGVLRDGADQERDGDPRRGPELERRSPDSRRRPRFAPERAPSGLDERDSSDGRLDPRAPWSAEPRFELVPGPSRDGAGREDGVLRFTRRSPEGPYGLGLLPRGLEDGDGRPLRVGALGGGQATDAPPSDAPEAEGPLPTEGPTDDPELACETEVIAPGACVGVADLKTQATEATCADGLYLVSFDLDLGGCGDGLAAAAKYTCCPPASAPLPEEKPTTPGEGSICKPLSITLDACAPTSTLDAEASKQCGEGALIVDHKYTGDCADGSATEGWFTCCPVAMDMQDG